MRKEKAADFMRESLLSGYRHHPYALEQELSRLMEKGEWDSIISDELNLETYADILAPDRLRAMKNSLICLAAVISRSAIDRGVPPEKSFAVSDFYINEIETQNSPGQLQQLLRQMLREYSRLEQEAKKKAEEDYNSAAFILTQEHEALDALYRKAESLADALRAHRILGAGLDVFAQEPLPLDSPLIGLDNVILTPHESAQTIDALWNIYARAIEICSDFFAGKELARADFLNPDVNKTA